MKLAQDRLKLQALVSGLLKRCVLLLDIQLIAFTYQSHMIVSLTVTVELPCRSPEGPSSNFDNSAAAC